MDRAETAQAIYDKINRAADGDGDEALRILGRITKDVDGRQAYAICCAIAEPAKAALRRMFPYMVWAASAYVYGSASDMDPNGDDPVVQWAARFLVAYANKDHDNAQALFVAALKLGPGGLGERMVALVGQTAVLVRRAVPGGPT